MYHVGLHKQVTAYAHPVPAVTPTCIFSCLCCPSCARSAGLDFSAASMVVFVELPHEVSLVRQAEDRAHRWETGHVGRFSKCTVVAATSLHHLCTTVP